MNKQDNKIIKTHNYETMVAIGATGSGSRNRTMRTKKEKLKCPKRQRKQDKHYE